MRFWRKKPESGAGSTPEPSNHAKEVRERRPATAPVKGTKIRLFLHPPGRSARLLEVILPDDETANDVSLRCFEPPPEGGGGGGNTPSKAWKVDLTDDDVRRIRERASAIRLIPLGGRSGAGDGSTVEITISAGPAEARLKWWMTPPEGWSTATELVESLRQLSGEEL